MKLQNHIYNLPLITLLNPKGKLLQNVFSNNIVIISFSFQNKNGIHNPTQYIGHAYEDQLLYVKLYAL